MCEFEEIEPSPLDAELERKFNRINFIKINIHIDMVMAEERYETDYENNVDGIKDMKLSFYQWLSGKEIEALQFRIDII